MIVRPTFLLSNKSKDFQYGYRIINGKCPRFAKKISAAQDDLAQKRVKGVAKNGAVIVDMTGKYDIISVNIAPDAMSFDAAKLSELVTDAYRDAKEKADIFILRVYLLPENSVV